MNDVELNLKVEEALAGQGWGYWAGVGFRKRDQHVGWPYSRKKHGTQAGQTEGKVEREGMR